MDPVQAAGTAGATPSSADACMSIVHSLMWYRQGGESEQFSKRAIESLVKKLKEKRDELDCLITAITTNGAHSTKCVTIPRTLDGRLQIAGRKCFPHVIYAKIWRWPDLHKNELRRSEECRFAFDLKVDSVCVNPYHYIRDVSLGVDLTALNLHQQQQMYPPGPDNPDWNYHQPNWSSGYDYGAGPYVANPPIPPPGYHANEIVYSHQDQPASWHHQVSRNSTVCYKADQEEDNKGSEENNKASTWSAGTAPETKSPEQPSNTSSSRRTSNETSFQVQQSPPPTNDNEPMSRAPLPDHWCSITYHELDTPVGETFKASRPLVQVDGYVETEDKSRFCVGALTNVQRKPASENTRLHIGKGIQLELEGEGDVWLHCLSRYAVYVQSHYLDWIQESRQGRKLCELVHKFHPYARYKVFDLRQCCKKMKERIAASQDTAVGAAVPNGGHLAPALSHATAASGFGIDDLRKLCTIRVSFVKGYGPNYPRKNIVETPCWIEVQLHRGLQVLDEKFVQQMQSKNLQENGAASPSASTEVPNSSTAGLLSAANRGNPGLLALCT